MVCPDCQASMPEGAAFCPGCGRRVVVSPDSGDSPVSRLDHVAAALAYVSFVPAVILLRHPSYQRNSLVRFHARQSIFLSIAVVLAAIVLRILFVLLSLIPHFGYLVAWLLVLVATLAVGTVWLVVVIKALQGERFKLPWIGSLAERA